MEATVSRAALVRELNLARGVVEARATIPVLANVVLQAAGEAVTITASDLDTFLRCTISARVRKPGIVTVPAARLRDYVSLLPGEDVELKASGNHWLSVACGKSRARMAGLDPESFPEMPSRPADAVAEMPLEDLATMIGRVAFAIATAESRFTLNGALMAFEGGRLRLVATDGHRLCMAEGSVESAKKWRVLVPRKALREVEKIAHAEGGGQVEIYRDDTCVYFETLSRLYITRTLSGQFPEYERVLPKEQSRSVAVRREELAAVVARVAQFADDATNCVRVTIGAGELKLHASMTMSGESEETLPCDEQGPAVEMGYNAQYLLDFLKGGDTEHVRLQFEDAQSACEMQPVRDGEDLHRYVVMPMRV